MNDVLSDLTRKPDRRGDRQVLDAVFDECVVATVSTVIDGQPWVIPALVVRDGDRLLIHGSTGAGALRHAAAGAPVAISAFVLDGIVVAERQFDHSANYRSAVVRGTCRGVDKADRAAALDVFTDALLPGRPAECPPHTPSEVAATLVLELPIAQDNWVAKQRSGPAAEPEGEAWTGVIPVSQIYSTPESDSEHSVPASVAAVVARNGLP
ncbi:pyridoxamine 5'-phosphate oxidase family protein [Mycobacterium sp. C3-094]|uniref:pyridoxamine 5'-phosphate oxidase family protein n=1 Tax=Mycobacterium sp. PSTR-4-N TaxID=2917745 RepID=UPI001F14C6A7|nr:pyridoxamine 5'-phosphate oxidase family protein [Mycobacterium sp. PSTR-4-N]MCG7594178.1 pyridoxamine 5'-phosphate oxidase family protein [Mycobacterium sp. PSTR-4-N]